MWEEDEDNNPYASSPGAIEYTRPFTPESNHSSPRRDSAEFVPRPHDLSDVEYDDERPHHITPKKGAYEGRVEQLLYESPDSIKITYAGKNSESGGSYIVYTIQTGEIQVRRRYSEFASLRATLVNMHPTLVIPPIPEKHTMADYAAKPTKAKEDIGIIDLRKRMLAVFLNRCRRMPEVLDDGVWWRFLDPNVSWNEVLNTPPVSNIPKNVLKAPPLNTTNPTTAHSYLPVPSSSAKLKSSLSSTSSATPTSPSNYNSSSQPTGDTIPPSHFNRFPPSTEQLSEEELDPYFINFEASSKELENLLQGSMEKSNRRMLSHYSSLAEDLMELGARYNAFSLSEQSPTLATAIEKIGQAADTTYMVTGDFSTQLSATFAEPMRESAQFAGVVRSVLRYRVLKRVQEEMAKDDLERKRALLANLKDQEEQSARMSATLNNYTGPTTPRRSNSGGSRPSPDRRRDDDVASIDSDFPPTMGDASPPSANQGQAEAPASNHKKSTSGGFISNKIFGRLSHAFQGVVDSDPVKTRQDLIGKTSEQVKQLEQAIVVSHDDVKDASAGVLKDLKRFQGEKEEDLKRYMLAFAKCHIEWAKRNMEGWVDAKKEVEHIHIEDIREFDHQGNAL
ncbi:sorting nexin-like protein-41 [Microthyrium microscopicum]|uniref:Sorting nexin-like protein-41 n=1 Tax=Microthyrium microscopicum TaxID=703497 RepID=A0A6A6UPM7_9PEZI|nr:sorting nexin-like protein-41 [Microthyrium microscopicum]